MNCLVILSLFLVQVTNGVKKNFFLHSNGDNGPGLRVAMEDANFTSLSSFGANLWNMLESGPAGMFRRTTSAPQLVNQVGVFIKTWSDIRSGDHIYVVPYGSYFIWPAVKVGHKVIFPESYLPSPIEYQPMQMETISLYPRAFRIRNFLTRQEAQAVIEYNKDRLSRSKVGAPSPLVIRKKKDNVTNQTQAWLEEDEPSSEAITDIRTSYNAFDSTSPAADALIKRSYNLLRIPYNNVTADGLQLVRYANKQAYDIHTDYFPIGYKPPNNFDPLAGGSNRFATIFMYLTTVEDGGETVFPHGEKLSAVEDESTMTDPRELFAEDSWEHDMVKLCRRTLASKAIVTEAVLFYSQTPSGLLDPYSEHGGCPVLKGDKWGANLWVWNGARITMRSSYHVTFVNKLPLEVALYFFMVQRPDGEMIPVADRTVEFLETIAPGDSRAFKCNSQDVFMAKTVVSDSIVGLYEIPDEPARGQFISFDIDNLSEAESIKKARTFEFMKGYELGFRGGHARGIEEGMQQAAKSSTSNTHECSLQPGSTGRQCSG